jgi:hypothetical protein
MDIQMQIELLSDRIEENNRLIMQLEKNKTEEQLKNALLKNDSLVHKRLVLIKRLNCERAA